MYKNEKKTQKSLFANSIMVHLKISIKATERLLGLTREFSKLARCKGYLY